LLLTFKPGSRWSAHLQRTGGVMASTWLTAFNVDVWGAPGEMADEARRFPARPSPPPC